jgi:hypothetical protein
MAYVAARPKGRFEVRESLHTPKGPRSRTLAGFDVLTETVLAMAAERAQRPFDAGAVVKSARRAGAPVEIGVPAELPAGAVAAPAMAAGSSAGDSGRFVQASRRMARSLRAEPSRRQTDPGDALIDLLGFADEVARSQPARRREALRFPVLARLLAARGATAIQPSR